MRSVVIGLGNPFRGDDAAGIEVVRRLRDAGVAGLDLHAHDGEPLGLIDRMAGAETVFIVDAVRGEAPAGTVHRFELGDEPIPGLPRRDSTHAVGLTDVLELARDLDGLPIRVVVIGIEGERFDAASGLSDAVAKAVDDVVAMLTSTAATQNGGGGS